MTKKLHITNGDSLTNYLQDLEVEGTMLTWREMLCEGATSYYVGSEDFIAKRKGFLENYYGIPTDQYLDKFIEQIKDPKSLLAYDEIILWFEYDLFCHINMIAAISWLHQHQIERPIFLVCSGRVEGENGLKGLAELTKEQLLQHYENKVNLNRADLALADELWRLYNTEHPEKFKKYTTHSSSFRYLSSCLSAHLKRFPSTHNGLSLLEVHILNLIEQESIRSKHQLLGYTLFRQGYYGFGDTQIEHIIQKMSSFFELEDDYLILNEKGKRALNKQQNYAEELKDNMVFGGANKYDYKYEINSRNLTRIL